MSEFVYILTHDRVPGLVKIGFTTKDVADRVANINAATGVPAEGWQEYDSVEVANAHRLESHIHAVLSDFRHHSSREFFEMSPRLAASYVREIVRDCEFRVQISSKTNADAYDTVAQLGTIIRRERKRQGVTIEQLSGLANVGGRFLSELERGKETAEIAKVLKVLRTLGLNSLIQHR